MGFIDDKKQNDGGYHAIKGFTYQFDATLLEIFRNPRAIAEIEGKQDLSVENYHIQIKNRSAKYAPSEIKPAIHLMIQQFTKDPTARFCLHCHFPDQVAGTTRPLTPEELEKILSDFPGSVDEISRQKFRESCIINFASNYEAQFSETLAMIRQELGARDAAEAVSYHAILHGYLREAVLSSPIGRRFVDLNGLKSAVSTAKTAIFESTYVEHCGYEKYLRAVRQRYRPKSVNVMSWERIFSFECTPSTDPYVLAEISLILRQKYFIPYNSPAPYLTFRGEFDSTSLKKAMWDIGARFNDGTGYHGGIFRMEDLVTPPAGDPGLKIIDSEYLPSFLSRVPVREFHDFYRAERIEKPASVTRSSHVFLRSFEDIARILL